MSLTCLRVWEAGFHPKADRESCHPAVTHAVITLSKVREEICGGFLSIIYIGNYETFSVVQEALSR
jgi:hypothetical protein